MQSLLGNYVSKIGPYSADGSFYYFSSFPGDASGEGIRSAGICFTRLRCMNQWQRCNANLTWDLRFSVLGHGIIRCKPMRIYCNQYGRVGKWSNDNVITRCYKVFSIKVLSHTQWEAGSTPKLTASCASDSNRTFPSKYKHIWWHYCALLFKQPIMLLVMRKPCASQTISAKGPRGASENVKHALTHVNSPKAVSRSALPLHGG